MKCSWILMLAALASPAWAESSFPSARTANGLIGAMATVQPAYDEGRITLIYVDADNFAIRLDDGFPNASALHTCHNGWFAGDTGLSNQMVAALMAAKASASRVRVGVDGCSDLGWLKVTHFYVID